MIKNIHVEGIGEIVLARRRGTRSIRLSVSGDRVRLGAPYSISERQAIEFAMKKRDWINKHRQPEVLLPDGSRIGKAHRLRFEQTEASKITTKITDGTVLVRLPRGMTADQPPAQTAAKRVAKKALIEESESLLRQRLKDLAGQTGYAYRSLAIKTIKSRWGSCSNQSEIVLNAFLIQLPWRIIDYVIIHELVHTRHHNHSRQFWSEVEQFVPDHKDRRKILKTYHTDVLPNDERGTTNG